MSDVKVAMTPCPAAITIAGTSYPCRNVEVPHSSPTRHWAVTDQESDPAYWTQHVPPPKPLTLMEWLRQEVPYNESYGGYSVGYLNGRQAVLDAAARWEPPKLESVDLDALAAVMSANYYGLFRETARAVVKHLGLEAK